MALPSVPLATGTALVAGTEVTIRALSRAEALHVRTMVDAAADAEAYVIAHSTGVTVEEAARWLDETDNETAQDLVRKIMEMSGLVDRDSPNPEIPSES